MTERNFWRRLGIALVLTLGLAPIDDGLAQSPQRGTPIPASKAFSPRLDATGACSDSEWIGLASGARCEDLGGQDVFPRLPPLSSGKSFCRFLRSPGTVVLFDEQQGSVQGLVRKCGVVGPLQVAAPPTPTPRQAFPSDFDRKLEGPDPLTLASRETLEREFLFQVGKTTLPFAAGENPRVRIAFLDTHASWPPPDERGTTLSAPKGGVPSGASGHGYALAQMARELVCDSSCGATTCAAKISTRLALPLRKNSTAHGEPFTAFQQGGSFGSPSDLAVAIREEVAEWTRLKSPVVGEPPHLILNLSLGWDHEILTSPKDDGGLGMVGTDGLNAEEMAVQAALEEAAAAGVLVIAASGNGSGPKLGKLTGGGALWPAAWSIGAPPTRPKTGANTWSPTNLIPISGKPLVWAIGGIDRRGSPLANVRTKSTPTLVAYGDHAVARDLDGKYTDVLTGTSVSAAVASSIAALVWHARPDLSASTVMSLVERSAFTLPRFAEHHRPLYELRDPSDPESLAAALSSGPPTVDDPQVGSEGVQSTTSPTTTSSSSRRLQPPSPPSVRRLTMGPALALAWHSKSLEQKIKGTKLEKVILCSEAPAMKVECGKDENKRTETIYLCGATTLNNHLVCPARLFSTDDQAPWTLPQPGENQCPTCSVGGGPPPLYGKDVAPVKNLRPLSIAMPRSWQGGCLTDLRVDVEIYGGGTWSRAFVFPDEKICNAEGQRSLTVYLPIQKNITLGKATLAFKFADRPLSGTIPLYLIDQLPEEN